MTRIDIRRGLGFVVGSWSRHIVTVHRSSRDTCTSTSDLLDAFRACRCRLTIFLYITGIDHAFGPFHRSGKTAVFIVT